jgi:hypothetical protein
MVVDAFKALVAVGELKMHVAPLDQGVGLPILTQLEFLQESVPRQSTTAAATDCSSSSSSSCGQLTIRPPLLQQSCCINCGN